MPSKRRRSSLLLVALLFAGCDSQRDVTRGLCDTLSRCTNLCHPDCETQLADDVNDHRISSASIAICEDCLKRNVDWPRADCSAILVRRECDKACADLPVVLRAHTNEKARAELCEDVAMQCVNRCALYDGNRGLAGAGGNGGAPGAFGTSGTPGEGGESGATCEPLGGSSGSAGAAGAAGTPRGAGAGAGRTGASGSSGQASLDYECKTEKGGACDVDLANSVKGSPTLDVEIARCRNCVNESHELDGNAPGGPDAVCRSIISRCTDACKLVPRISERLTGASECFAREDQAILAYCVERVRCDASFGNCVDRARSAFATSTGGDPLARMEACTACLMPVACDACPTPDESCKEVCQGLPTRGP